jgi:hypothetical protein
LYLIDFIKVCLGFIKPEAGEDEAVFFFEGLWFFMEHG